MDQNEILINGQNNNFVNGFSFSRNSCSAVDFNNDGFLDISSIGGLNKKIYSNNGDGINFTELTFNNTMSFS